MNIPCKIDPLGTLDILPVGYTRLEYLGAKQFTKIDTLLRVSPETGAQIRGRNLWNNNPDYSALCGVEAQFLVLGVNPTTRVPSFAWSTQANNNSWVALTNGLVIKTQESGAFSGLIPYSDFGDFRASLNFCMSGKWEYTEGELALSGELPAGGAGSLLNIYLFARNYSVYDYMTRYSWRGIVYSAVFSEGKKIVRNFIPALDSAGVPCMFDTVTRQTFHNSGSGAFIAGVDTQSQLNQLLCNLPDLSGQPVGTLTVRLADDLQTAVNRTAMDAMLSKNWEITEAA